MYIFMSVNMYATRRCTHGVPTMYPYPQYPWLTEPEGRRVRVLTGTGTGQPGITRGLPVLIPSCPNGDNSSYIGIGTNQRLEDPTDGCKGSLPQWNIKREGLYASTRGI